jgi:transposase-like protein
MAKVELKKEYPFLLAEAMQLKIQHRDAVRSATALIVVVISEDRYREILGFKIALREIAESWVELKDRGLQRVELATSNAQEGLESAL